MYRFISSLALICLLVPVENAESSMLGMERVEINFTKPSSVKKKVTWGPSKKITLTSKGLGWKGQPQSSWSGWILSAPMAVGTSWRPTRSVGLRVLLTPAPTLITLANGQKYTPYGGQVFARFSPDKKYWSTWQPLQRSTKMKGVLMFNGTLGAPRRASKRYNALLKKYSRRKDVPWRSDEEALVSSIVKRNPQFFKTNKPFVGYVQVLWEGSFRGSQRMTSLKIQATYAVSGMHYRAKKSVTKKHKGPWRFVHPSLKKP